MGIWDPPPEIAAIFNKPKAERNKEDSFLVLQWIERPAQGEVEVIGSEGAAPEDPRHEGQVMRHRPRKEDVFRSAWSIQPDDMEDDWAAYTHGRIEQADEFGFDRTEFHRAVTDYEPGHKGGRRFDSWLKLCFGRFCIKRQKRRKSQELAQWPHRLDGTAAFDPPDPASATGWVNLTADLLDEIGSLPDREHRAIIAYYFEEKSLCEVAHELGVAIGNAAVILHRARRLVKEGLIRRGWDPDEIGTILDERRPAAGPK